MKAPTLTARISSSARKPLIPRSDSAIAIDPGYAKKTEGCAVAQAIDGRLTHAWFERPANFEHASALNAVDHVIVEQPQQDGRSDGVPPAVLIRLTWAGGTLAGLYAGAAGAQLHEPTPREWKGSEAKPAMHERMWAILSEAERRVLGGAATAKAIDAACERGALCRWSKSGAELYPSTFVTHNLLDAAAILMWAYGRLEKVG